MNFFLLGIVNDLKGLLSRERENLSTHSMVLISPSNSCVNKKDFLSITG